MFELSIKREFNTAVSTLFNAWTDPILVTKWFAPGDICVAEADVDATEGGQYRIVMQDVDGKQFIVSGTYQEIIENERLVFSWKWQDSDITTKVKVLFEVRKNNASALELIHTEFVDQESCDKHNMGWNGCLANLYKAI